MALISYMLIFSSFFSSVLLSFFPSAFTYKQYALVLVIATIIAILNYLYRNGFVISKRCFITIFIGITVVVLYWLTPNFYDIRNENYQDVYNSFRLAITGQTLPTVVVASLVGENHKIRTDIMKLAPIIGTIFTAIALIAAFNPTSMTSGGYALNENGLEYQTISYMAAYASALLEYYILTRNENAHYQVFKSRLAGLVAALLVFVNALTVLVGGGRGGFVAYILFLGFTAFLLVKRNQLSVNTLIKGFIVLVLVVIAGYWAISIAAKSSVSTNGFSRILDLLSGSGDRGRNILKEKALALFKQKPITGNGLGSVLLSMGLYSHNFFVDVLAEMGIWGLIVIVALLFYTATKGMRLISEHTADSLWMYIFFCGFIMSIFSGYYLDQFPIWWTIAFIINHVEEIEEVDG